MSCFVYLIDMPEMAHGRLEMFKVGISANPQARLSQLATACPFGVLLRKTWRMESREDAYLIEQEFHAYNARWRRCREWFFGNLPGALCELDDDVMRFWIERRGVSVDNVRGYLRYAGIDEDMISDLICAQYGEPPYDWVHTP